MQLRPSDALTTAGIVAVNSATVREVHDQLLAAYGAPRLGNPAEPLDDLVFIVLSNKTAPSTASRAFNSLRVEFETWEALADSPVDRIANQILFAGLAFRRAAYLKAMLTRIRDDFGACDLGPLRAAAWADAEDYLCSLPGVSRKVAKCVGLFTLGAEVLPVDAHVHRLATRLGWTTRPRADQAQLELEGIVPAGLRYGLHVGAILHGRDRCRPQRPRCEACPVARHCGHGAA